MERTSVQSSAIASIGYDPNTGTLEIEFIRGGLYAYYEVPQYEYDGLMAAESHNKYAIQNIYKVYRQQKMG